MGMDHVYGWQLTEPSDRLVGAHRVARAPGGAGVFDATLALRRREINRRASCAARSPRYPLLTHADPRAHLHATRCACACAGRSYFPHPRRGALRSMSARARATRRVAWHERRATRASRRLVLGAARAHRAAE